MSDVAPEIKTREEAVRYVLLVLRNPLMLMSVPNRDEAKELSLEYGLTAHELLEAATNRARQT